MDANVERYDRQIRLWGQHGQNKCSDARVCLINANSLGAEILKGLCLAGIAGYTILDSHKLTLEDLGSLFIPHDSVGKNRGDIVKEMLFRMNPEVSGQVQPIEKYLPQMPSKECDPDQFFRNGKYVCENVNFWKLFNIVIVAGSVHVDQLREISDICSSIGLPLIVAKSVGFYGMMRSQIDQHVIIETHPDNPLADFRLDKPFPELKDYLESINLEDTKNLDKINTYPYLVIVYHYLRKWQHQNCFESHRIPLTHQEKISIKNLINDGLRRISEARKTQVPNGVESSQEVLYENYQEATKAINSCFTISNDLPKNVRGLFDNKNLNNPFETNRPTFWLILSAIKQFYFSSSVNNTLPLSGKIPDMIASTEEYIKIQKIYSKRAREDVEEVFNIVQNKIPAGSHPNGQSLYEETKLLCKNIRDLKLMVTSAIKTDYDLKDMKLKEEFEDDESIAIGLGLRSLDIFYSIYGRFPGLQTDRVETDISKLKDCLKQIIGKTSNKLKNLDQSLYEICRVGGSEIHATSAFMGGIVAQEVIKFITNQYVTIDDTIIYNAISQTTQCLKLEDAFEAI